MSLLDLFTGAASKRAATQNAAAIAQGQTQSNNALDMGTNQGIGLLGVTNGWGGGTALSSLSSNYQRARDDLGTSNDKVQDILGQTGTLYNSLTQTGLDASNARSDALGLNGADGYARAKTAFQNSLGYNAGLDEGIKQIMGTAAARGGLAGGNTTADILKFTADYQNRQAGSYLDRLNGVASDYTTGLQGQAGVLGTRAAATQGYGTALGNLGTSLGAGQAGIYGQGANTYTNLGQQKAGVFSTATNQTIGNNIARAQADNAAGANILGALFGGLNTLSGGAGSTAGRGAGGGDLSPTGGANFSPYANSNPFVSGIANFGSGIRNLFL